MGRFQYGRCWNAKATGVLKKVRFEQSHADPCAFKRIVDTEVKATIVVMHVVRDILALSKTIN